MITYRRMVRPKDDHKIVRFNTAIEDGDIEHWKAVYFIEENGELSMQVMNNVMRYYDKDFVLDNLKKVGFANVNVRYEDAAKMKDANMLFMAMK